MDFFKTKNIKTRLIISGVLFALGIFIFIFMGFLTQKVPWPFDFRFVQAASSDNIRGWGWSENIGWISMNCYNDYGNDGQFENCCHGGDAAACTPYGGLVCDGGTNAGLTCTDIGDCPGGIACGVDYGVDYNETSYKLSGYGWAGDTIGWICYGETCSGTPPHGYQNSWACVGLPSWKCNGGDNNGLSCGTNANCPNGTCDFSCTGDAGEGFLDTASLNGHWKMNILGGTSGGCNNQSNCTPDLAQTNPAFLQNGPLTAPGKYDKSFKLDGEDDYFSVADAAVISFTGDFTIEAWIKRKDPLVSNEQTIIGKWDDTTGNIKRSYRLWLDAADKLNFSVSGDGTTVATIIQNPLCLEGTNDGQSCITDANCPGGGVCKDQPITNTKKWYHLAGKYVNPANGSPFLRIFVDGWRVKNTVSGTVPSAIYDSDESLYFGTKKGASAMDTYFPGFIDNVSVWNRPKTGNEIWDDSKIEIAGWAKAVAMDDEGWLKLRGFTLGDNVWGTYLRSFGTFYTVGGYMAERHNNEDMDANGLLAHWKMNQPKWDGITDEVTDSSGNSNHGTAQNGAVASNKGKFSSAGEFDGTDDSIVVTNSIDFDVSSGDFTLEAWFRIDKESTDGTRMGIITRARDSGTPANKQGYLIGRDSNNKITFLTGDGIGANNFTNSNNTYTNSDNDWHHVAAVYKSGTKYLYIDGVQQTDTDTVVVDDYNGDLILGEFWTSGGNHFWQGFIDNVSIYNRGKSSNEIANDYDKRKPYSIGWGDYDHAFSGPPVPSTFNTFTLDSSGFCDQTLAFWEESTWADTYTYERCDSVLEGTCGSCTYNEYSFLGSCTGGTCTLQDTGLSANTGYCYNVTAHNESGDTVITNNSPTYPAPQWVSTVLCAPTSSSINTNTCGEMAPKWGTVVNADGYNVYRSLASNGCDNINTSTCELIGHLAEGMDYDADDDATNDLIGHWKMNESSWNGTTDEVADSSIQSNHGTAVCDGGGCVVPDTTSSGFFDRAGNFDGSQDYIDVGKNPGEFNLTDSFTVEAWVNPALDSSNDIIIGNAWEGSPGWHLRITSGNKARLMLMENGSNYIYAESSTLSSGWRHVVGVWDGSNLKIYIDGDEATTETSSGTVTNIDTIDNTYLGNISGQTLYFNGTMDNVAIYNIAKTAEQIRVDYEAGNCGESSCGLTDVCGLTACGSANTCCYTDQRIVPFIDYYYVITATSEAGESLESSPLTGQTICFPASEAEEE